MIHHNDIDREDRAITRELWIVAGILFGCAALAVIAVALWP
jgi:hypothetical protein